MDLKKAILDRVAQAEALKAQAEEAKRPLTESEMMEYKGHVDAASMLGDMVAAAATEDLEKKTGEAQLEALKAVAANADPESGAGGGDSAAGDGVKVGDVEMKAFAEHFNLILGDTEQPKSELTLGDRFVEMKSYRQRVEAGGGLLSGQACVMGMDSVDGVEFKALVMSPETGTGPIRVAPQEHPERKLLGAFNTSMRTNRDSMTTHRYVFTPAATLVPEGEAKPEASLTYVASTETVIKIAHSIPVTEEALSDHSYLRTVIDTEMVNGVLDEVERRCALWLNSLSGVQVVPFDTNPLVSLRRGISAVETFGNPTGILMNNVDGADLELMTDSTGRFLGGGPFNGGPGNVWQLPKLTTSAIPSGTAIIGPLKSLQWIERSPVTIRTGWVNNQFKENELTILAETRGMNDVLFPGKFARVALQ